ncbi:MAG: hypothetical protein MJB12_09790 [Firmicutes bacterium]|nr:hypothetical protein [Bacillota bacterium]
MTNNYKFHFTGYEIAGNNDTGNGEMQKCSLLYTSVNANSLYEALKEFKQYEITNRKKHKVVKILEGAPDIQAEDL